MKKNFILSIITAIFFSTNALAADAEYNIIIKDHKFTPDIIEVPANTQIKLIIDNQDISPEEFESHDFNREKIINGNSKAVILVSPLEAGEYKFFGEFNPKTAQGKLIAR